MNESISKPELETVLSVYVYVIYNILKGIYNKINVLNMMWLRRLGVEY